MPKTGWARFEREAERLRALIRSSVSPFGHDPGGARQERLKKAEQDREYFLKTYLPHYFGLQFAEFHREWLDLADTENRLVLVAAPREHAKSTLFTFGLPLHALLFQKKKFILIVSDTEDQARGFTLPMKMELLQNPRIIHDFGEMKGSPFKDADFVAKNGVRVKARGRGQRVRGLKSRQHRPDMAVVDDFENDRNVRNPRLVKEGLDWLLTAVLGSLAEPFQMFMVGNIFASRSILSRLMSMKDDTGAALYTSRVYRALDDRGEPLWPAAWSRERLMKRRRLMGAVRFNREMMNRVVDEDGPVRPGWFRYYHPRDIEGEDLAVASFLDPSAGSGKRGDFKALVTVGLDAAASVFYVLHAWIKRATIGEMLRACHAVHREYGGAFGAEVNMLEDFLLRAFEDYARQHNSWLPLTRVRHSTQKRARILGEIAPLLEFGRLRFQKGHSDQDVLIEQILYLDDGTVHDDGPDALAGALAMLREGGPNIF